MRVGRSGRPATRSAAPLRRRRWLLRFLTVAAGMLAPLFCLELMLRALPVPGAARRLPVNAEEPIARFEPNREFLWSRDWNFSLVNEVRINNFGFVSDADYDAEDASPLLAVIGDSYVEAFMVPFRETCAGRLATRLNGRARVYAFGVSGAPLSQYLAFAEYARDTFRPGALAVVVISNDYDESLLQYGRKPGLHQFADRGDGQLRLQRTDLDRGVLLELARASALARYLVGNLDVLNIGENARRLLDGEVDRREREPGSKRAVDAFLDMLPAASGLAPARIAFVVDGVRPALYETGRPGRDEDGFTGVMRRYFLQNAARLGYHVVDLQPVFTGHHRLHGERFEWPQDEHWNSLGHRLCADAASRWDMLSDGSPLLTGSGGGKG